MQTGETKQKPIDIHHREKQIIWAKNALNRSAISERNKQLIKDFLDARKKQGKVKSELREIKLLSKLRQIAELLGKDLDTAEKKDIDRLYEQIKGFTVKRRRY
jgi:hypothetical protein